MENGKFLFNAGKLKEIQNETYEQTSVLFDLLFHLQQELYGVSASWQGDASGIFMEDIQNWWEDACRQVERLQELGALLSQAENKVRNCENQVKQELGGWFG